MKKIIKNMCVLTIVISMFGLTLSGCKSASVTPQLLSKEEIEAVMPEGTVKCFIDEANNNLFEGFGAEIDPQFIQFNVGRSGVNSANKSWSCKLEDWENIFVPRMREMNLKKIRVMLLPSWFADTEAVYKSKKYTFNSDGWKSLELVLSTAQQLGMSVNLTMWGIDAGAGWMGEPMMNGQWITIPTSNEVFCNVYADALEYLMDIKGYSCIKEVTPYNEPDTVYTPYLGVSGAFKSYADLCFKMQEVFTQRGLRDKLKFNLSDDANRISWLEASVLELSEIADLFNSHSYSFGKEMTNDDMNGDEIFGAFGKIKQAVGQSGVPHMFGEFGTNTTQPPNGCVDRYAKSRGIDVARIAINALNSGSAGLNYWVLFSQFYSNNTNFDEIMSMGLWGFADELYECRPVYYAYSLLTRFTEIGSKIYPIFTKDENITAVGFKNLAGKWTYLAVNTAEKAMQISFGNLVGKTNSFSQYIYSNDESYQDGQQISSSGTISGTSQLTSLFAPGNALMVLTEN